MNGMQIALLMDIEKDMKELNALLKNSFEASEVAKREDLKKLFTARTQRTLSPPENLVSCLEEADYMLDRFAEQVLTKR